MRYLPTHSPLYALVATTRALLLVELHSKSVTPIEWDRPEYYGITWAPNEKDLILSHSMLDNNELRDIVSYAQSEVGVLSNGNQNSLPFLSQPHQISYSSDNRIICTNTGRNSISIYNINKPGLIEEARLPHSARWDRLSATDIPGDHLNSVFERDGKLFAIAHRHSKGSALATFSFPALELIALDPIKNRTGLHNIWVTNDGQYISCHSESGSLIDVRSDRTLWESGSDIYTRGLAASKDFVLVGESQKSERASRRYSISALWLLDRTTWRALDYFYLGPYGAVHEVRLLNVADEAHHGHCFSGLDALLQRDQRIDMTNTRLSAARRVLALHKHWASFSLLMGAPIATADSGQLSMPGDLCLFVRRVELATDKTLTFSYTLDQSPGESHVAIIAYRGQGGDTDMSALLIERLPNGKATIGRWDHDGQAWQRRSDPSIDDIPISGTVRFSATDHEATLYIDERHIHGPLLNDFVTETSLPGIRWYGATLYPMDGPDTGN